MFRQVIVYSLINYILVIYHLIFYYLLFIIINNNYWQFCWWGLGLHCYYYTFCFFTSSSKYQNILVLKHNSTFFFILPSF